MPIATKRPFQGYRPSSPVLVPAARPKPSLKARQHVLDVPFDMRGVAQAAGATWNKVAKCFSYSGPSLPLSLTPFQAPLYSWERYKEDELNGEIPAPRKPTKTITLRSHQQEATAAIEAARQAKLGGFLLADDVGLGKTLEAAVALLDMDDVETILIVCPLAVKAHWRRTITWLGDRGKRFVIINYDRLKSLFEVPDDILKKAGANRRKKKPKRVRTLKGVAKFGEAIDFDLVVFDESHRLRNRESARSKLASKIAAEADFILWLSATAGQNPLELSYLSPILSKAAGITTSKMSTEWEEWCQEQGWGVSRGAFGKWLWNGASSDQAVRLASEQALDRMHEMLFGGAIPMGLRRTPEDIAGWPSVNRILLPVDLEPEDRVLYLKAWAEFRDAVGMRRTGSADTQNGLVASLRFRQKASLLRTGATADLALELLAQGKQVAISVVFRETMDVLVEALTKEGYAVSRIDGKLSEKEKEAQRLDFQYGRTTAVVYSVEDGISLHQGEFEDGYQVPRVNLIHDLRWSAISTKQVEGRTHRDGKFSQVYWLMGAGTVEEDIAQVIADRMRSMSRMQGDEGTQADIERMLSDAAQTDRPALLAA